MGRGEAGSVKEVPVVGHCSFLASSKKAQDMSMSARASYIGTDTSTTNSTWLRAHGHSVSSHVGRFCYTIANPSSTSSSRRYLDALPENNIYIRHPHAHQPRSPRKPSNPSLPPPSKNAAHLPTRGWKNPPQKRPTNAASHPHPVVLPSRTYLYYPGSHSDRDTTRRRLGIGRSTLSGRQAPLPGFGCSTCKEGGGSTRTSGCFYAR